jgi:hypothetical protein
VLADSSTKYTTFQNLKGKGSSQNEKVLNRDRKALHFLFSEVSTERFKTIQKRRNEIETVVRFMDIETKFHEMAYSLHLSLSK